MGLFSSSATGHAEVPGGSKKTRTHPVRSMPSFDRILVVHNGALGDFIQVWPSLLALSRFWPPTPIFWAGRPAYRHWTEKLMPQASAEDQAAVRTLYSATQWPDQLQNTLVVWFGLLHIPVSCVHPQLWPITGLAENDLTPPRQRYAQALEQRGIPQAQDWQSVWCSLPPSPCPQTDRRVLIAPGAGNDRKCWPLPRFMAVARWLARNGKKPVFLLGPAELERGVDVQNFELTAPSHLSELQQHLAHAELVLSNDAGPMHLAAAWQTPTLSIFGPSSAHQWAPPETVTIASARPCRPCTRDGRIACSDLSCLYDIPVSRVVNRLKTMLNPSL